MGRPLRVLLEHQEWHSRLLNGSDYPLPAVMPLFSLVGMVGAGYLGEAEAEVLSAIRRYNPLLFDFALKRRIQVGGKRFAPAVFHTRRVFAQA
jgi:mannonate dehydratase